MMLLCKTYPLELALQAAQHVVLYNASLDWSTVLIGLVASYNT